MVANMTPLAQGQGFAYTRTTIGMDRTGLVPTTDDAPYCYYRMPNGWITSALWGKPDQEFKLQELRYEKEGWQSLREQYGVFAQNPYMIEHELEFLLMRGGAHEIPVAQLQALGWDREPPKIPLCGACVGTQHRLVMGSVKHTTRCWSGAPVAVFPQMEGIPVPEKPAPCPFCESDDFPREAARSQHIRVMHKEQLAQLEQSKQISDALRQSLGALAAPQPFACGICKEGFDTVDSMLEHMTLHEGQEMPARPRRGRPPKNQEPTPSHGGPVEEVNDGAI